jgi:hypothetical protein
MKKLKDIIGKTLFWSYERGTLPYDLMVIAIVLFVFFSPRTWFNDRPGNSGASAEVSIVLVGEDSESGMKTYRVQADLLSQPKPDPAFERRVHEFLSKSVPELRGSHFQIRNIQTGQDSDGTIRYFDVSVKK